ncbi:hypothetical protein GCM10028856_26910 [Halopiger thermotolerans]
MPSSRGELTIPAPAIGEKRANRVVRRYGKATVRAGTQWADMRHAYVQRDGACTFRPFNYLVVRDLQLESSGSSSARTTATGKRRGG